MKINNQGRELSMKMNEEPRTDFAEFEFEHTGMFMPGGTKV